MYYEAKVLFVLYLWHPKTQGAVYLYNSMLQPFLSQNEGAIDQCIEELKSAFFDYAAHYFQRLEAFPTIPLHSRCVTEACQGSTFKSPLTKQNMFLWPARLPVSI